MLKVCCTNILQCVKKVKSHWNDFSLYLFLSFFFQVELQHTSCFKTHIPWLVHILFIYLWCTIKNQHTYTCFVLFSFFFLEKTCFCLGWCSVGMRQHGHGTKGDDLIIYDTGSYCKKYKHLQYSLSFIDDHLEDKHNREIIPYANCGYAVRKNLFYRTHTSHFT